MIRNTALSYGRAGKLAVDLGIGPDEIFPLVLTAQALIGIEDFSA